MSKKKGARFLCKSSGDFGAWVLGWTRPLFLHLKPVSACALLFVPRPSPAHVSYAFKIEAVAYCADFTHEDTSILL